MKLRSSGAMQTGSRSQAVSKILACLLMMRQQVYEGSNEVP